MMVGSHRTHSVGLDCDHLSHTDTEAKVDTIPMATICRTCGDYVDLIHNCNWHVGGAKTLSNRVATSTTEPEAIRSQPLHRLRSPR